MIAISADILQQLGSRQGNDAQSSTGTDAASQDFLTALVPLLFAGQGGESGKQSAGQQYGDQQQTLLSYTGLPPDLMPAVAANEQPAEAADLLAELNKQTGAINRRALEDLAQLLSGQKTTGQVSAGELQHEVTAQLQQMKEPLKAAYPQCAEKIETLPTAEAVKLAAQTAQINELNSRAGTASAQLLVNQETNAVSDLTGSTPEVNPELTAQVQQLKENLKAVYPQHAEKIETLLGSIKTLPTAEAVKLPAQPEQINELKNQTMLMNRQAGAEQGQLLNQGIKMPFETVQQEAMTLQKKQTVQEINKTVVSKAGEAPGLAEKLTDAAAVRPVERSAAGIFNQNNQQPHDPAAQTANRQISTGQTQSMQQFAVNAVNPVVNSANALQTDGTVPLSQLADHLTNLMQQTVVRQNNQAVTVRLKLEPEHLGEITVRLTYQRGELNTHIYTSGVQAKEALEAALPQIRDALAQQSVKLNEAAVFLGQQGGGSGGGYYRQPRHNRWGTTAYRSYDSGMPVSEIASGTAKAADSGVNLLI